MRDSEPATGTLAVVGVGVGASTSGLEALLEMLGARRVAGQLAYVIVQHCDPDSDGLPAEILGRGTGLDVTQVETGQRIRAGTVHLAPPGHGLAVSEGILTLRAFQGPAGSRRPIDEFLHSLALDFGNRAAGVILSGTGSDGSAGLRAIKEHGGLCVSQVPAKAERDGIPVAAEVTGPVDLVLRPDEIVKAIGRHFADRAADDLSDPTDARARISMRRRTGERDAEATGEIGRDDGRVARLEAELRETRQRLSATVEELETANGELKSANEEMMSMNEELAAVNRELTSKIDELSVANADLSNFFASTALPLVVVDAAGRIRNFTAAIGAIYPLRHDDRGRPLSQVTSHVADSDTVLTETVRALEQGEVRHVQVAARDRSRTWSMAVTPYRARNGDVAGAMLAFSEITEALRLAEALKREGERLRLTLDMADLGVWELGKKRDTIVLDGTAGRLLAAAGEELAVADLLGAVAAADRDTVAAALRGCAGSEQVDVTFALDGTRGGDGQADMRNLRLVGRRTDRGAGASMLGVIFDVTAQETARQAREAMLQEMNHRVKNTFAIVSGLVRGAGRRSETIPELVDDVVQRINALARSHDMTHRARAKTPLRMRDAVGAALDPYRGQAEIALDGPDIAVDHADLTALSLLFHELATNAAKYGVFGPIDGRLDVSWSAAPSGRVELRWTEHYASDVAVEEAGEGFGATLLRLSAAQLQGKVTVDREDGLRRTVIGYDGKL